MTLPLGRGDFPPGFLFGAATAAYQIEGASFGGCGPSHWDTFAATPGNVTRGQDGAVACDHYHRFADDLDLVAAAGFDAYRFSTSWARVMPDGVSVNSQGLDFYDRLVDAICARGIAPYLTLYHWDLPAALADLGGWTNQDTADRFADFAQTIIACIGDRVAATATVNEPWCVSWLSHFVGHHAPGLRDIRAATRSMHIILVAHAKALAAMRAAGQPNLGIVLNLTSAQPASDTPGDIRAARVLDGVFNRWFLDGVFKGAYPADILDALGPHMPHGFDNDMASIAAPLDWLGVNYYTRALLAGDPGAPWPAMRDVAGALPKTQMGWEIYAQGLTEMLTRVHRDYAPGLPIHVTENGMAWDDRVENGAVHDPERTAYIGEHLNAARAALDAGVNLKGFFYWSLLDNFEWAFGYDKRFGLVHVDFETQARTPKASFHDLARMLAPDGP